MASFILTNCDFGSSYNGTNYDFTKEVDSVVIEDPQMKKLTRGGSGKSKTGIAYSEGMKDARKVTITLVGLPASYLKLLKSLFESEERIDSYCVDRKTGITRSFNNSLISQEPKQLAIQEGAESLNILLILETFDIVEEFGDVE